MAHRMLGQRQGTRRQGPKIYRNQSGGAGLTRRPEALHRGGARRSGFNQFARSIVRLREERVGGWNYVAIEMLLRKLQASAANFHCAPCFKSMGEYKSHV